YRLPVWRGVALPVVAMFYMLFTLDSAIAQHRGQGGMWKGEAGPAPPPG
ncbi:MAG: glycosyl transferase family 2, partial [Alphaproteobacteria bacterium]|nr:glycosyl transferase family 2 [Alphaproteobacteria bacterium]